MSKFCLRIGEIEINKKTLLVSILSLFQTIIAIIELFFPEKRKNHFLESTSIGLGQLAVFIVPHIKFFSISNEKKKTKYKCSKKIFLHYFILLVLYAVKCNALYFGYRKILGNEHSIFDIQISEFTTKQCIEILIINIISKFILKYKYFIHHYLSVIIFFLSGVGFDLILGNYSHKFGQLNWLDILCIILGFFIEGIYYCYIKYMLDIHYHHYWNIMLSIGIMVIFVNIITINVFIIIRNKPDLPYFIENFWNYFYKDEVPTKIIVSRFIINFVLQFFTNVLEILTLFYLPPEFIIISQFFCFMVVFIVKCIWKNIVFHDNYQFCFIIFHYMQSFGLLVYFELLELNFCGLNKNTRKNVKARVNNDLIEIIDRLNDDNIEIKGGYILKNTMNDSYEEDNIKIELNQIKIEQENNKDI